MGVLIVGVGSQLPERVLTNAEVEAGGDYEPGKHGGSSLDEWSRRHHGARTRHVARPGEATSDLATGAAQRALRQAGLAPRDLDLIVLATFTGDHRLPQAAGQVQSNLGGGAKFIQIDSACTGFIDGLMVAQALMEFHRYRRTLLVAADITSMLNHPRDWLQQTVFGDGAGAVILERTEDDGYGLRSFSTGSDGDIGHYVCVPGGGSRRPISRRVVEEDLQYWKFDFQRITPWAIDRMVFATHEALRRAGIRLEEVALIVPHQASVRILDGYVNAIGYPRERVVVTYPELGNVSGASIPIALEIALRQGRLSTGDWLLMPAVGAGMAWGAAAYRWKELPPGPDATRRPSSG